MSLPVVYSREDNPARRDQIASVEGWLPLQRITPNLMPYDSSIEIRLLIGYETEEINSWKG